MENNEKSFQEKMNEGIEKLNRIKEVIDNIIGIPNSEQYDIKTLRKIFYENNPDVFKNLIKAYNHIDEYLDNREVEDKYNEFLEDIFSDGKNIKNNQYVYYTEKSNVNEYTLINVILEDFARGIDCGSNHTEKGQEVKEENIHIILDFDQYVSGDIVSIKEIKDKWDLYSEKEKTQIKELVMKKFDTRIWVLKEAINDAIEFSKQEKERFKKDNIVKNIEDIDI